MAQFGDLLAELRQDRGLTQSELGKVISVTSGTISNYEHGFHLPDLEKLVLLADYFWCLNQIISWEEYHLIFRLTCCKRLSQMGPLFQM